MVDTLHSQIRQYCTGAYACKMNVQSKAQEVLSCLYDHLCLPDVSEESSGTHDVRYLSLDFQRHILEIRGGTEYSDGYLDDEWTESYGLQGTSVLSMLRDAVRIIREMVNPSEPTDHCIVC